jgi:ubiquinone biosynthesis protein Coq4
VLFNVVSRKSDLDPILAAIGAGYRGGKSAEPLFGIAWDELWGVPIDELRARFALDSAEIVGEGIRAAA